MNVTEDSFSTMPLHNVRQVDASAFACFFVPCESSEASDISYFSPPAWDDMRPSINKKKSQLFA